MQFRVPQFIDMEDKVVGPLTLKQFAYILGAGGFSFIIWTFMPIKIIAIVLILAISALFLALAFIKINNRPFADILESAFSYYTGNRVYTWKQPKDGDNVENNHIQQIVVETTKAATVARANKDRLHDLALGLDILDRTADEKEN